MLSQHNCAIVILGDADMNYTVKEIANMLNTNPETVRRWIRSKKLKAQKYSNKEGHVVDETELEQFLSTMPKYAHAAVRFGSIVNAVGGAAIPGYVGGLIGILGTEIAVKTGHDRKNIDLRISKEELHRYLEGEIIASQKSIKEKEIEIKRIRKEIEAENQRIAHIRNLMEDESDGPDEGE